MSNEQHHAAQDGCVRYEAPVLAAGQYAPVSLRYMVTELQDDGSRLLRFVVHREKGEQVVSFDLTYRFSQAPLSRADAEHQFHTFTFNKFGQDQKETIVCKARIPKNKPFAGCTAYVSRTEMADGMVFTYEAGDFVEVGSDAYKKLQSAAHPKAKSKKKGIHPLAVVIPLLSVIAIGVGAFALRYSGVQRTVRSLVSEQRYNEAYRVAGNTSFDAIQQEVCRAAADHYLALGDYTNAYTYAIAAPRPFGHEVALAAAQVCFNYDDLTVNEEIFKVAQKMENESDYDNLMQVVYTMAVQKKEYTVAMRAALSMKNTDKKMQTSGEVFLEAIRYYIAHQEYEQAISYMESFGALSGGVDEVAKELIDHCLSNNDPAGAIYLAGILKKDTSHITIQPDEPTVREDYQKSYFLLSAAQKRAFHARTVAISKEYFAITNGEMVKYGIKNASSVVSYGSRTVVLLDNGTVTAIRNGKVTKDDLLSTADDIVQVALGEDHAVYLHNDGRVTAYGANDRGQCNVQAWRDIVGIAAGRYFTVGLKSDGTLIACGSNDCGQGDLSAYRNVVSVAATGQATVMIFSDGSMRIRGETSMGLTDVNRITNAHRVRAEGTCVLVEKNDGSFQMVSGIMAGDYGSASSWANIADYDVGSVCIAAVTRDGKVLSSGDSLPAMK